MKREQAFNSGSDKESEDPKLVEKSSYNYLACLIILAVFLYACFRAFILSVTHDEVITTLVHSAGSYYEIFTFSLPINSNNHLINTLMIKWLVGFFGLSEFVIRVPALIGLVLYLVGVYALAKLFLKKHLLLVGTCLLVLNPFMLDFFSLARGYALALGFQSLGLYFAFKAVARVQNGSIARNTFIASVMLLLMVLSQLAFLTLFLSVMSVLVLMGVKSVIDLIREKAPQNAIIRRSLYRIVLPVIPGLLLLPTIYNPAALKRISIHLKSYGGASGFWSDTVTSLIKATLYGNNYSGFQIVFLVKLLVLLTLVSSVLLIAFRVLKRAELSALDRYLLFITAVAVISSLILVALNTFFEIRYIVKRTALYFIPLWIILLLVLWERLKSGRGKPVKRALNGIVSFLAVLAIVHFFNAANFTHSLEWKYDASTKDVMARIEKHAPGRVSINRSVQIGCDWIFEPSMNFYIIKNDLRWLAPVTRRSPDGEFDLYYLMDNSKNRDLIKRRNLKVIEEFKVSKTVFAVRGNLERLGACVSGQGRC